MKFEIMNFFLVYIEQVYRGHCDLKALQFYNIYLCKFCFKFKHSVHVMERAFFSSHLQHNGFHHFTVRLAVLTLKRKNIKEAVFLNRIFPSLNQSDILERAGIYHQFASSFAYFKFDTQLFQLI